MAAAVRSSPVDNTLGQPSNKRKRGNNDIGRSSSKDMKSQASTDDFSTALLQGMDVHVDEQSQRAAQAALAEGGSYVDPGNSFDAAGLPPFDDGSPTQGLATPQAHNMYPVGGVGGQPPGTGDKPSVGTPQWHQARKDSHKEVERRRREVINEGIDSIAKIVPGVEKNKGAILQRTHQYVLELQEQVAKFENERAMLQVTIEELTTRHETLKLSNRRAWNESNKWQQRCRDLGGEFDDYDSHGPQFDEPVDAESGAA